MGRRQSEPDSTDSVRKAARRGFLLCCWDGPATCAAFRMAGILNDPAWRLNFADADRHASELTDAWIEMLESTARAESVLRELQRRKLELPVVQTNFKPKTHELFDQIVPVALEFAKSLKSLKWQAERRRRTTTARTVSEQCARQRPTDRRGRNL